jgi:2-polyprenyl-3-methyl-5-hydroxy-6-metoxy-1,4-benzoquinol methylase
MINENKTYNVLSKIAGIMAHVMALTKSVKPLKVDKRFLKRYYERQASFLLDHQAEMYCGTDAIGLTRSKMVIETISELMPTSMLDVGCAEGYYVRAFKTQNREGVGIGLDLSLCYLKKAKVSEPKIELIEADAEFLPLRDSSLEMVLCSEVLEHTPSPRNVLSELTRVACKHIIVTTPSHSLLYYIVSPLLMKSRTLARLFIGESYGNPFTSLGPGCGHLNELSLAEIMRWAFEFNCHVMKAKVRYSLVVPILPKKLTKHFSNLVDILINKLPIAARKGLIQFLLLVKQ